jgi:hypothetical protein
MTKHVTYNTDTTLVGTTNEIIQFLGKNDTLAFGYSSDTDTVIARGVDQTIRTARAGTITIDDHSHGLTLQFNSPSTGMVVQDFQNDSTGKVVVSFPSSMTFASDHHGGTTATGFGVSVDFQGFRNIAALEARFNH